MKRDIDLNPKYLGFSELQIRRLIEKKFSLTKDTQEIIGHAKFSFAKINDSLFDLEGNSANKDEIILFSKRRLLDREDNLKIISISENETDDNLTFEIKYTAKLKDSYWIKNNLKRLQRIEARKIGIYSDFYIFRVLDYSLTFFFTKKDEKNHKFIKKMNKMKNQYDQLRYFLFYSKEGKIETKLGKELMLISNIAGKLGIECAEHSISTKFNEKDFKISIPYYGIYEGEIYEGFDKLNFSLKYVEKHRLNSEKTGFKDLDVNIGTKLFPFNGVFYNIYSHGSLRKLELEKRIRKNNVISDLINWDKVRGLLDEKEYRYDSHDRMIFTIGKKLYIGMAIVGKNGISKGWFQQVDFYTMLEKIKFTDKEKELWNIDTIKKDPFFKSLSTEIGEKISLEEIPYVIEENTEDSHAKDVAKVMKKLYPSKDISVNLLAYYLTTSDKYGWWILVDITMDNVSKLFIGALGGYNSDINLSLTEVTPDKTFTMKNGVNEFNTLDPYFDKYLKELEEPLKIEHSGPIKVDTRRHPLKHEDPIGWAIALREVMNS